MRAAILLGVMAALPQPGLAQSSMQPGLWEITASLQTPGLPPPMPPRKSTQCIKDSSGQGSLLPKLEGCRMKRHMAADEKMRWTFACYGADTVMTGSGEMTFKKTSYEAYNDMTIKRGNANPIQIVTRYSGRRIGECK